MWMTLLSGCGTKSYTVEFELNGGALVSGEVQQTVEDGGAAVAPEVQRLGYVFDGWDTVFDEIHEDTTVSAQWTAVYRASFDPGMGEIVSGEENQDIRAGETPKAPEVKRDGYDFTGWDPAVDAITDDVVYTAQWERTVLSSEEIFDKISPSVVEIAIFDEAGVELALGSGFFVDGNGTLVTNYHVMEGAYTAEVTLSDSTVCDIVGVVDYDADLDLAIVRVDISGNEYIEISNDPIITGETIYALGSSLGLTGTFSDGIVSAVSRDVDGVDCIQMTAPISHGNSGGPLVNVYGDVIGVNSMTLTDGQNINLSINIEELNRLDRSGSMTMDEFYEETDGYLYGTLAPSSGGNSTDFDAGFYGEAESSEWEPNDYMVLADALDNGPWMAAELTTDDGDVDYFSVTVTRPTTIMFWLVPYYTVDQDYIYAGVVDEDENVLGVLLNEEDEDGLLYQYLELEVDRAGTYYLMVFLPDDYPYSESAYYEVSADW